MISALTLDQVSIRNGNPNTPDVNAFVGALHGHTQCIGLQFGDILLQHVENVVSCTTITTP
jgi:hypothetical protein